MGHSGNEFHFAICGQLRDEFRIGRSEYPLVAKHSIMKRIFGEREPGSV